MNGKRKVDTVDAFFLGSTTISNYSLLLSILRGLIFGSSVGQAYRMPLGGMTNLHHPTSCSRKKNCDPRWLEVRQMVNVFLDQPYGDAAVNAMIGRRWDLSNCDCTCGECHTFLAECPLVKAQVSVLFSSVAFQIQFRGSSLAVYSQSLHLDFRFRVMHVQQ